MRTACGSAGAQGHRGGGGRLALVDVNKATYVLVDLSSNDIQEYYNGLANSVLWPILHYRVDLQEFSQHADASGYMRVNRLFADHLSALMKRTTSSGCTTII